MRISDWGSDGCSSDLRDLPVAAGRSPRCRLADRVSAPDRLPAALPVLRHRLRLTWRAVAGHRRHPSRGGETRRAPSLPEDRKNGGEGERGAVRVGLGVGRAVKEKKHNMKRKKSK